MPEVMQQQIPESQQAQPADNTPPSAPEPESNQQSIPTDLTSRVSQVKLEASEPQSQDNIDEFKFDVNKLESIRTPEEAKAWAQDAYKSFQRGYNSKYEELAKIRKSFEEKSSPQPWTPERVQELLNDQTFVQAAQNVTQTVGDLTEEEYSMLNETEKKQFRSMQSQVEMLQRQAFVAQKAQQDSLLKSRYSNYNPQEIDQLEQGLISGQITATREHLHKAFDYDNAINRAYTLGRQDERSGVKEKINAASYEGINTVAQTDVPSKNEGEKSVDYFKRLAHWRISQNRGANIRK